MLPSSTVGQDFEQNEPDPVLSEAHFPHRRILHPLGFALDLSSNSKHVIEAAVESWGAYEKAFDHPPVQVQMGVHGDDPALPARSIFRSRSHLMSMIATPHNFVMTDFNTASAFGWVTAPVAADYPVLRYRFLMPTVLMLLQQRSLATIHSALIARNGRGVVLFGESNSGKSTLAYACARAGWTFIADDATYLLRNEPARRAIGASHSVHFRHDAHEFFPELAGRAPGVRPNGKVGIEVFTRELPIATALGCEIDHFVHLNRFEPCPARLAPFPGDRLRAWCEQTVAYGSDEVRAAQLRCYDRLEGAGIWELRYRRLDDAIARLEQLVDSGG